MMATGLTVRGKVTARWNLPTVMFLRAYGKLTNAKAQERYPMLQGNTMMATGTSTNVMARVE